MNRVVSWLKSGSPLAILLKWVGTASALISLFLGSVQVTSLLAKRRASHAAARELLAAANLKLTTKDYAQAWALASQAVDSVPSSAPAKTMQLAVAMAWLRDLHLSSSGGEASFSGVADKLTPVLLRAAARTKGPEKADVLAHLGWLTFLKWRDGARSLSVAQPYRQALAVDPGNLYAHAMLAHWLLYPGGGGGTLQEAQAHFATALSSARTPEERRFVRSWQASALLNRDDEFAPELIRLAAAMKAEGDSLSPADRSRILWVAYTPASPSALEHLADSVPAAQQREAFAWLAQGMNTDRNAHYRTVLARLTELSGDTALAMLRYRAILKDFPTLPPAEREFITRAVRQRVPARN